MATGNMNGRAGMLAFVVATAWLACEARWLGGWLTHVPLAADLRTMAGEGAIPSGWLAPLLGGDAVVWRITAAVLVAFFGVRVGLIVARTWSAPAAAWLLPALLVIHPFALLASRDVPATVVALWCVVGAVVLELLIRSGTRTGLSALAIGAIAALAWSFENVASWAAAVGELCAPVGDPEAGTPWRRRASFAVPVVVLLGLGHRRRLEGDEVPMLGGLLVLTIGLSAGGLVQALGLAWVLAFASARAWSHRSDRWVVVAAGLLMALSGHNTARLVDAQARTTRDGVEALLQRLEELPSAPGVELVDVVIGRAVLGDAVGLAFPERDVRAGVDLVDPGTGRQLRVSRFGRARDGWRLEPVMRATRVTELRLMLHEPPHDASLESRRAEDEPTFAWSVPIAEDPGPGGFTFVWAGHPVDASGRTVRSVPLSPTQLARSERDERAYYAWRPSVRATDGGHRELLWEHEELTRRATTMTWTVVARPKGRLHGFLMAAPRRLTPR